MSNVNGDEQTMRRNMKLCTKTLNIYTQWFQQTGSQEGFLGKWA